MLGAGDVPQGLKVILSSDWPAVQLLVLLLVLLLLVLGLLECVGLWERPTGLSALETRDRPVRRVAVWGKQFNEFKENSSAGGRSSAHFASSSPWRV